MNACPVSTKGKYKIDRSIINVRESEKKSIIHNTPVTIVKIPIKTNTTAANSVKKILEIV